MRGPAGRPAADLRGWDKQANGERADGRTATVAHATPLGPDEQGRPRTAVIEAVIAASDRPGFASARTAARLLRPLMRAAAGRPWRDDLGYAERRWHLRSTGCFPAD